MTTESVRWAVGSKHSDLFVTVTVGYRFDVSVPWFARILINRRDPRFLKAAALHDYCLEVLRWDRVTSAGVFSEALRADGVSRAKRLVMVAAVAFFRYS